MDHNIWKSASARRRGTASTSRRLRTRKVETYAEVFQQCRDARRIALMEDYVKLIPDLIVQSGEARPIDIAQRLGVTPPTVAKMLERLVKRGLITHRPYRGVFLTDDGYQMAAATLHRYNIVEAVLCRLGVDPDTAKSDAEAIEHCVSGETVRVLERYLKRM